MADRKKLIDLLLCVPSAEVVFGKREGKRYTTAWHIANHLISHGVTVRERGRWIEDYETFVNDNGYESEPIHTGFVCSVCGRHSLSIEPYCHCGADMRGEEDGT